MTVRHTVMRPVTLILLLCSACFGEIEATSSGDDESSSSESSSGGASTTTSTTTGGGSGGDEEGGEATSTGVCAADGEGCEAHADCCAGLFCVDWTGEQTCADITPASESSGSESTSDESESGSTGEPEESSESSGDVPACAANFEECADLPCCEGLFCYPQTPPSCGPMP